MAVKLRLTRVGKTKQPQYRIVAADSRSPRDGRFIQIIGTYNPRANPSAIHVDNQKAAKWLLDGAQPTDRVRKLLEISGAFRVFETERSARAAHGRLVGAASRGGRILPNPPSTELGGEIIESEPNWILEQHGDLLCLSWASRVAFADFRVLATKVFQGDPDDAVGLGERTTFARLEWDEFGGVALTWHHDPMLERLGPRQLGAIFHPQAAGLVQRFASLAGNVPKGMLGSISAS